MLATALISRLIVRHGTRWQRWLVGAIAIAGYLVSIVGFPVSRPTAHLQGAPFPCQEHACGCATAEECWASCCCFSAAERLAWARSHHVDPPAELVAAARSERATDHCEHSHHESCAHCASLADNHRPAATIFLSSQWVRQCRGLPGLWCVAGAVAPPPGAVRWEFEWRLVEWLRLPATVLTSADLLPAVPPPRV